ncbi:type II toxin-antitoxin system VapC family toxin [Aquibium pacificus]
MEDILLEPARRHLISPVNYLEAAIRVDGLKESAKGQELDPLLESLGISLAAIDAEQAHLAREAYRRFGKGNHPAKLNIGDCFAYALAKARDEPLLFKGGDFQLTNVEAAL